eukprot:190435-Rhodomonas_salina.2
MRPWDPQLNLEQKQTQQPQQETNMQWNHDQHRRSRRERGGRPVDDFGLYSVAEQAAHPARHPDRRLHAEVPGAPRKDLTRRVVGRRHARVHILEPAPAHVLEVAAHDGLDHRVALLAALMRPQRHAVDALQVNSPGVGRLRQQKPIVKTHAHSRV